jgi:hypothetical protein
MAILRQQSRSWPACVSRSRRLSVHLCGLCLASDCAEASPASSSSSPRYACFPIVFIACFAFVMPGRGSRVSLEHLGVFAGHGAALLASMLSRGRVMMDDAHGPSDEKLAN